MVLHFIKRIVYRYIECPKIYRKSVLHLLKQICGILKPMQYRFAENFWDTQYSKNVGWEGFPWVSVENSSPRAGSSRWIQNKVSKSYGRNRIYSCEYIIIFMYNTSQNYGFDILKAFEKSGKKREPSIFGYVLALISL